MSSGKSSYWSITINNPTDGDIQQWNGLGSQPWVRKVEGQLEKGEEGTTHIQGMVQTEYGRFLQKLREALPRAHIELAKNKFALANYVTKEETRVAAIPTVKVATQADVQNKLLKIILKSSHQKYPWEGCKTTYFDEWLLKFEYELKRDWEFWLDVSVAELIREGYYGVEFVAANQQVRNAFRKYLPDILYRQWRATREADVIQRNIVSTSEDRSVLISEDLE